MAVKTEKVVPLEEVPRAEFFRNHWVNLTAGKRRQLNELFTLNRQLLAAAKIELVTFEKAA